MSELKLRPPSQLPQEQLFKLGHYLRSGSGVIWNGIPFETLVIPAKAGIQSVGDVFPMACGVDSRFRGNDGAWERQCLANDTITCRARTLRHFSPLCYLRKFRDSEEF